MNKSFFMFKESTILNKNRFRQYINLYMVVILYNKQLKSKTKLVVAKELNFNKYIKVTN